MATAKAGAHERAALLFEMGADPGRLKILLGLEAGEECVGRIVGRLGATQPAVSHHLALLRVSNVVECERRGKNNFYSLTDDGRKLVEAARGFGA